MTHLSFQFRFALLPALLFAVAGCSSSQSENSAGGESAQGPFAPPSGLTATLVENAHMDLKWRNNSAEAGGYWVEFTTPGDDFVKLDPVGPEVTTYRHPDVAPNSVFVYRIVPFFGRSSETLEITTGKAPPENVANLQEEGPLPETGPAPSGVSRASIRNITTFSEAAPAELTAELSSETSVALRWKDRATDEDGFVVEIAADPEGEFQVCALLPADAVSFNKTHLPPEMRLFFRVRAFFYGEPSNTVSARTAERSNETAGTEK